MSAPAAPAAAEELDDLYGGMDEDVPAAPTTTAAAAPPPSSKRGTTPAERAAEAAAEAERSARARLAPAQPITAAREVPIIREGDYAVFDLNGEKLSIQHVHASA
jgi:hypothetical protein